MKIEGRDRKNATSIFSPGKQLARGTDLKEMEIYIADPHSKEALLLFQSLDAELLTLYPKESVHSADPKDLKDGRGFLLMASVKKKPIACGAVRKLSTGIGEVKRMYVSPEWRGKGISREILRSLEREACKRNISRLKLETGALQPAAIALYQTSGFNQIPPFGEYIGDPTSVCFEKILEREI